MINELNERKNKLNLKLTVLEKQPQSQAEKKGQISESLRLAEKEKQEYLKVKYRDDRRISYPDIGDQLDDLYKKGAFSDDMTAKIKAVKDANPKPK